MAYSVIYDSSNLIPNDVEHVVLPADRISIVGHFSCDDTKGTIGEATRCYLIERPFPSPQEEPQFNLLEGLESFIPKVDFDEKFDYQQDFLAQNYKDETELESIANVFTARGCLSKLLDIPVNQKYIYNPARAKWRFIVLKVKNVLFIMEGDTDGPQNNWELGDNLPYTYSGYRFEQRMTTHKQGSREFIEEPVNRLKRQYSVAHSQLIKGDSTIKLWYTAEVDGIDKDGNYVELKTIPWNQIGKGNVKNPNKCRVIWEQSMLFGSKRIIIGRKGQKHLGREFYVEEILDIPLDRIGDQIANEQSIMLDTLYAILIKLQQELGNGEAAHLEKYELGRNVEIRLIPKHFNDVNFLRRRQFLDKFGINIG